MTPTTATLPTANPDWGFWGAIRHHADQAEAWRLAMQAIGAATACGETAVRDFLDSRFGRHLADDVGNGLSEGMNLAEAVDAAPLDGLDDHPPHGARHRHPKRAALPDRLRHPLRDHGRGRLNALASGSPLPAAPPRSPRGSGS